MAKKKPSTNVNVTAFETLRAGRVNLPNQLSHKRTLLLCFLED